MRYKILDQNGMNFLTMTIVEWIDLFTRPVYSNIVLDSLRFCQEKKGLVVFAYVIMPSHLHLIVRTDNSIGLSRIIQSFKTYTSNQFLDYINDWKKPESRRKWLLNHFAFNARKNRTNSKHNLWVGDNHPIALYTPKVIRTKLNYIHNNPVEAEVVNKPEHYRFSSASNYVSGNGVLDVTIIEDIWNDTGFVFTGM
ncbi:MAG: transposase [Bacteroidetes bacterium]|nr:MAG: transposase [Bacteroidota bacterium]